MAIAQQMGVEVSTAGELVVLKIGNLGFSLHFATALKLSLELLESGRTVRRLFGQKTNYRVAGALTDAAAEKVKPSRFAAKPPPELKDVGAEACGRLVRLRLGAINADMPFEAALAMSQWLRIRGKEARNSINEKENWHRIAAADA